MFTLINREVPVFKTPCAEGIMRTAANLVSFHKVGVRSDRWEIGNLPQVNKILDLDLEIKHGLLQVSDLIGRWPVFHAVLRALRDDWSNDDITLLRIVNRVVREPVPLLHLQYTGVVTFLQNYVHPKLWAEEWCCRTRNCSEYWVFDMAWLLELSKIPEKVKKDFISVVLPPRKSATSLEGAFYRVKAGGQLLVSRRLVPTQIGDHVYYVYPVPYEILDCVDWMYS